MFLFFRTKSATFFALLPGKAGFPQFLHWVYLLTLAFTAVKSPHYILLIINTLRNYKKDKNIQSIDCQILTEIFMSVCVSRPEKGLHFLVNNPVLSLHFIFVL